MFPTWLDDPRQAGSTAFDMPDSTETQTIHAQPAREPAASPCVGVCRLDDRQICVGCGRHIVEITAAGVAAQRAQARKSRKD